MYGGHFMTYDTLHLSRWSRFIDHTRGEYATNADHVGVRRQLARMAMAIRLRPERHGSMNLRSFMAMAEMIVNADSYIADGAPAAHPAIMHDDYIETIVAYRIVKVICVSNGISRSRLLNKMDAALVWDDPGTGTVDIGILTEERNADRVKCVALKDW
ncbi:hypothetical protein FA95DRAFT_1614330 [Auriscalpium vulgare]|uniref:Uncharacterized protein n=1 Tax=Auriscalpium vulgare TaxID=40419 RepID=A0ACB8QZW2_9AGAM|nr:hypothetical protein FA95DRAFT_1614330 [Auriscalpium vulgare]